jgi:hypothetical protein
MEGPSSDSKPGDPPCPDAQAEASSFDKIKKHVKEFVEASPEEHKK